MSVTLFPLTQPAAVPTSGDLPLYREVAWDYSNNVPLVRQGSPVYAEGKQAVLVWAWKALQVPRFRKEIYTRAYGCELDSLIGQPYSEDTKKAEARRYIREALLINPYITEVGNSRINFADGRLMVNVEISTVYGDGEVSEIV
ncbi:MAG: DUF2634 domain-containing protein [Peptococcaceae bacterium]|nr:DUF2634 domain-containing protein [Peptococcaceae bacterium]